MEGNDLISVLAFILSLAATIISVFTNFREKQRAMKREITDLLTKISSLQIENAKLFKENASDPIFCQTVSTVLNQQNAFLLQQVAYLMDKVPELVTCVEYNSLAVASSTAGDIGTAAKYFAKAVETAPPPYYKALALRSYGVFLFTIHEFEHARNCFRNSLTMLSGGDNFARSTRGLTYQAWGWNEVNIANAPQVAGALFESAANEFRGIDNKVLRDNALNALAVARMPVMAMPVPPPPPPPAATGQAA
jgi:tetratricopeptide (TPR) repeat protein